MNLPVPLPPQAPRPRQPTQAQRIAATWFLGFAGVMLVVFLWLRGAGRAIVPLLLVGGVVWVLVRIVRKIREPLP